MEDDDVFEDAKEELPEQIDTGLHEAVFRNDLPEISALLRAAKERSQVRTTYVCNLKYAIQIAYFKDFGKCAWSNTHLRSKVWSVRRTSKGTQPCTWQ